ncbi:MAG: phosphatase PAP2 family protein [Bdellovibrionaceae bacterium]|nr:phosphatase PAP2 family protein [Pseudobdellovibrionaceae bacterium]
MKAQVKPFNRLVSFGFGAAGLLAAAFLILTSEVTEARMGEHETIGVLDKASQVFFIHLRTELGFILENIMVFITDIGSPEALIGIGVCAAMLLVMKKRYRDALFLACAGTISSIAIYFLKHHYARPRPENVSWLIDVSGFSYPSGHATGSATIFTALALILASGRSERVSWVLAVAAFVSYSLIAISRIYLGAHYLSDVLAGGLLGTSISLMFWGFFGAFPAQSDGAES